MVALEGHDPDPNFVATPSSNDLAQPLTQAGAAPCGCTPKLAGSFQLQGTTNPNDKGKITDAIADAFAKENQGINLTFPFILHEVTITNLVFFPIVSIIYKQILIGILKKMNCLVHITQQWIYFQVLFQNSLLNRC